MLALQGDLNQMAIQMRELHLNGIKSCVQGGIPFIEKEVFPRALTIIWIDSIHGWWNYKDEFIKYGLCTEKEFNEKLSNGR